MDAGAFLFDYDQAAEKIHYGYAPETIAGFCDDGTLVRGEHFIVRTFRSGSYVWRVRMITLAGIQRLLERLTARIPSKHGRQRTRTSDRTATVRTAPRQPHIETT